MISIAFRHNILEGNSAMRVQSLHRLYRLGLTPQSIRVSHAKAGGEFYKDLTPYLGRKFYMSLLKLIYVGPTKYVYFLTSDKELYATTNSKGMRVDDHGETAERRFTIRRFDMTSPVDIDIPFPHIFREYGTASRAGAAIRRLVREEWTTWVEKVNDLTAGTHAIIRANEEAEVRAIKIKNGTYIYTPKERFKMPLI